MVTRRRGKMINLWIRLAELTQLFVDVSLSFLNTPPSLIIQAFGFIYQTLSRLSLHLSIGIFGEVGACPLLMVEPGWGLNKLGHGYKRWVQLKMDFFFKGPEQLNKWLKGGNCSCYNNLLLVWNYCLTPVLATCESEKLLVHIQIKWILRI